jgi:hypothetical protein
MEWFQVLTALITNLDPNKKARLSTLLLPMKPLAKLYQTNLWLLRAPEHIPETLSSMQVCNVMPTEKSEYVVLWSGQIEQKRLKHLARHFTRSLSNLVSSAIYAPWLQTMTRGTEWPCVRVSRTNPTRPSTTRSKFCSRLLKLTKRQRK